MFCMQSLEHLMYNKIIDFIGPHLSNFQYRFIRGRSLLQQLFTFIHLILTEMQNKHQADVVYMDFQKAFDSVMHTILLKKF